MLDFDIGKRNNNQKLLYYKTVYYNFQKEKQPTGKTVNRFTNLN